FQGAGCYRHFIPAAVDRVLSRSEFATAYTPYQAEVSQGTLLAGFEFQTYVAILTGLDLANVSLYDGASALAEAVLLSLRVGPKRDLVLVSAGVHPEYIAVVRTYIEGYGRGRVVLVPLAADGRTDLGRLEGLLSEDVAAVCTGYPNFYGVIDDLSGVSKLAKGCGALSISVTQEALALALLRSPGSCGAEVAVAEGQSFGLPLSWGGPGVGLFAVRGEYIRQMPGRLVGETVDEDGRRGYVLTLSTREQHIRRDRATSNICTNQGLAALAVTVYLGLAGRCGLRQLAELNAARAHQLASRLSVEVGLEPAFSGPFFNEFAVDVGGQGWFEDSVSRGIVPGVRLAALAEADQRCPEDRMLISVTECNSDSDFDALIEELKRAAR
ncbi:MAG: aminomethyl-transferring glycine dehydrogenase subunit GcvPA, partial [Candidatus Binatia bacterium]